MTFLTLDIETVAQERMRSTPRTWVADPDWCAEQFPKYTADEIAGLARAGSVPVAATGVVPSLHPTTASVVQVSFGWRAGHDIERKVVQRDDYPGDGWEGALLHDAIGILAGAVGKRSVVVTFNGKAFDLPILRHRAALLGLCDLPRIPWRRLLYPYSDEQHADLRLILGNDNRYAKGTLQWWAEAFGVHAEEHGADVQGWVGAGNWQALREYGQVEAQTLVELYECVQVVV